MSEKTRFKDFDAAVEESDKESIEVKIAGRNYEFPPELPARVVLGQSSNWQKRKKNVNESFN